MNGEFGWQRRLVFLLLLQICSIVLFAQQAGFTADKKSGCSPLTVSFTNTSTGFSSNAVYTWDFGNGNTSALTDPGTTYQDEQVYDVTLSVKDGSNISKITTTVTVWKKPVVNFSVDVTKGCVPLTINYTSNSTPGDGTIASYFWDYGDGSAGIGNQQTQHTYTTPQSVTPSLTVTNNYGCYNTVTKPDIVQVLPGVTASFSSSKTFLCKVAESVTFTNTSSGPGTLSYLWDFGDGTTSTQQTPVHPFDTKGSFNVKLTVKNSDGCTADTVQTALINVDNFTTDFTTSPISCSNLADTFTDNSSPLVAGQRWLVNNKIIAIDTSKAVFTFPAAGTYKIQLSNTYGACKDTAVKTVTVLQSPIVSGFVAVKQSTCGAPVTVQFTDTTKNAAQWAWDFNNIYAVNFNPSAFTQTPTYTYTSNGSYQVMLKVSNAAGCYDTVRQTIIISPPTATIVSSMGAFGCVPFTTVFSATSSANITSFLWNFGDATPTSTEATPTHTFVNEGSYTITLTYTNADGCSGTATYVVNVSKIVDIDFIADPGTTICGNNPVTFNLIPPDAAGNFQWNFGDDDGFGSSNVHQYYNDSVFTVTLIVSNGACSDTVIKKDYITVLPPFTNIGSKTNTCDGTRGIVTFNDKTEKATKWNWDFGDNTAPVVYTTYTPTIGHTYTKTGTYKVMLTSFNGGCSVKDSIITHVLLKQQPLLTSPLTEICGTAQLPLTIANLDTNPAPGADPLYYHDFNIGELQYGDGSTFAGDTSTTDEYWRNTFHLNITNLSNSKQDIRLITNSFYFNCPDTTNYIKVKVRGPNVGYVLKNDNTCFKTPVTFTDTSSGINSVPIVKWDWDFGDDTRIVKASGGSIDHTYDTPAGYYPTLTVVDKDGCSATYKPLDSIIRKGPKADFTMAPNPVAPGTLVSYFNGTNTYGNSANSTVYTWVFGDGARTNATFTDTPTHAYANLGVDTVLLIARNDADKCIDTARQPLYVKNMYLQFTDTSVYINPDSGCPPILATFTNTSIHTSSVSWDFGNGKTAGNLNFPTNLYDKPGTYTVTLYGYFSDGSVDSIKHNITIKGPYATLKTNRIFACGAEPITLSAVATNTTDYTWDFGDGTLSNVKNNTAVHRYLTPGIYTPSLIVADGNKCSFPYFLNQPIIIDTLHVAIVQTPKIVCDSSLVLFTPDIVSLAKDQLQKPLTYAWQLGTPTGIQTSSTETASYTYNKAGTYPVTLSMESPYGCAEQATINIAISPTPQGSIAGPDALCQGDSAAFTGNANVASSLLNWQWQIANNTISSLPNTTNQAFTTPGVSQVMMVIQKGGCSDTAYKTVTVFATPNVNITPKNPQICQGSSVVLQAHNGVNYVWSPTNSNSSEHPTSNLSVAPTSNTVYTATAKDEHGCVNSDSVTVLVTQRFKVKASPLLYLCTGGTVQLDATGADAYHWIEGTNISDENIANPVSNTTTPQTYKVVGYDNQKCFTDTATTQVQIAQLPTVTASDDIMVNAGTPVTLTTSASPDVVSYTWSPADYLSCTNCATPVSTPRGDINYQVQVTSNRGCTATDEVRVTIICKGSFVQMASAFTPNGDGNNDYFNVTGRGIRLVQHFVVYSRFGDVLFEQNNANNGDNRNAGWDGTSKGKPMASGTYVYMADIQCDNGEVFRYKGTVVLIR